MRVWIDLANSPHVPFFEPVVRRLEDDHGWEVMLTARDNAQTVGLAERIWPDVEVIGGRSPAGRRRKAQAVLDRAWQLRRLARRRRPDVALSHGSYAQILAARAAGVPAVTMMDYEFQPANHVSFRLAQRVIVPAAFPGDALRRFGARSRKVRRYDGFKEQAYLSGFRPDESVLDELELDRDRMIAVFRPPPDGALYHRSPNARFDELLDEAASRGDVQAVVLPRTPEHASRYRERAGLIVPARPVDGRSLLALADVAIGGGGTMNRESALLGTPTYTVFAGRLAAVDAALIEAGLLQDLRADGALVLRKRPDAGTPSADGGGDAILDLIVSVLAEVARVESRVPRTRT